MQELLARQVHDDRVGGRRGHLQQVRQHERPVRPTRAHVAARAPDRSAQARSLVHHARRHELGERGDQLRRADDLLAAERRSAVCRLSLGRGAARRRAPLARQDVDHGEDQRGARSRAQKSHVQEASAGALASLQELQRTQDRMRNHSQVSIRERKKTLRTQRIIHTHTHTQFQQQLKQQKN